MRGLSTKYLSVSLLILIFVGAVATSEEPKPDLSVFSGNWEGEGIYILPFTNMPTSIEAVARFTFDSSKGFLRTYLTAEKFLMTYSDSGHLALNARSDSLSWEIWNNFGQHVRYFGKLKGTTIHGTRRRGKYTYDLYVNIENSDSISCRLTLTDSDGKTSDKASGYLRRVDSAE